MIYFSTFRWRRFWLAAFLLTLPLAALALNNCFSCKQEITGGIFIGTDQVTGEKFAVCSNCLVLPRCFLCSAPVKNNPTILPDGRYLCERDSKSVVLDATETRRICDTVKNDLDRRFSRFATFPANVDVDVIDRIDAFSMFHQTGFSFETPNLLGCIRPVSGKAGSRYWMQLMTGQTPAGLKATCAHEYAHAWVGDNVPPERRARIAHDAEEGFCEMTAYLLMESQHEEEQKKIILRNLYTRGQVYLFIEAEQRFGFEEVLDWMKFGNTPNLEPGRPEKIRDATVPVAKPVASEPPPLTTDAPSATTNLPPQRAAAAGFKLEGIVWGATPTAIINGHSFAPNEEARVKSGKVKVLVRCVAITKNSVRIWEVDSGAEHELQLP